jgi:hypothetical protein
MTRGPQLRQPSGKAEHLLEREPHIRQRFRGPLLNTAQAAEFSGRPNRAAFRKWALRARLVPIIPRGSRLLLYDKADIEAALRKVS